MAPDPPENLILQVSGLDVSYLQYQPHHDEAVLLQHHEVEWAWVFCFPFKVTAMAGLFGLVLADICLGHRTMILIKGTC